ncbi:MAG: DUF1972 domain-containing protein [Gordonia polyisoprenivorans]|nr:DUF1972 domain-containing protein [Gordonia polyisoprenivorans]
MSPSVAIVGSRGYPSFYGGFETLIRHLAPYLADQGWNVAVYGRSETEGEAARADPRIDRRHSRGVDTQRLSTLTYGLTASFDTCVRRPDVALVLNIANGFWLPMLRARGVPTVVNVDGIEWQRAKWGPLARGTFRKGARLTASFADELVCDAKEIARFWSETYGRKGIYIPYGADVPDEGSPPDELGDRPYALVVARLVPENTVAEFVAAADAITAHCDVVIVGSSGYGGPLEAAVADLAQRSPSVRWFGHLSDDATLFSLWRHAAAYFHGHSVGGTNPALVQAMACGAPIVARDTVYAREVLEDSAHLCAPTPDAIASAVIDLVTNVEEQKVLSKRAVERARRSFSWESVCASYAQALEDVATRGRAHR